MPRNKNRKYRRGKRKWRVQRLNPSLNYHVYRLTAVTDLRTDPVTGTGANPGTLCYFFKDHDMLKTVSRAASPPNTIGLSDITQLVNLYDQYRIKSCRIRYTPKYDKGAYLYEPGVGQLQGQPAGYISHDVDNVNIRQPKNLLVQKLSTKRVDMSKKWSYTWKPPRISMTDQPSAHISSKGWINLQGSPPNEGEVQLQTDAWLIGGNNLAQPVELTDQKIGEVLVEYIVEFRSRR